MGLTRAATLSAVKRYAFTSVVPVVVCLPAAAMETMPISTPTIPTAIRMSPTISQFTDVAMTWEPGSTANRMIAPAAASTSAMPILVILHPFTFGNGFWLGDSPHDEHGQRDDGDDDQDCDQ